jgi:hypothetical protein
MHNAFPPHDDLAAMKAGLQRFQEQLLDLSQQAGQMSETVSKMIGEDAYQEEPTPCGGTPDMEEDNTFGLTPEQLAEIDAILNADEGDESPNLGAESVIRVASDAHTSLGIEMDSDSESYIEDIATTAPTSIPTIDEQDTLPEDGTACQEEPAPDYGTPDMEEDNTFGLTPEEEAAMLSSAGRYTYGTVHQGLLPTLIERHKLIERRVLTQEEAQRLLQTPSDGPTPRKVLETLSRAMHYVMAGTPWPKPPPVTYEELEERRKALQIENQS